MSSALLSPAGFQHLASWRCWHAVADIQDVGRVVWAVYAGSEGMATEYARRAIARDWPLAEAWTLRLEEQ